MKANIINEEEKKLLGRKEVLFDVFFSGKTPTNSEVKAHVVALLKADEKLVIVKQINQIYGSNKAKVLIYIYNSEEDLKKGERKTRKSRKENKKNWLETKKGEKKMTEEEDKEEEKKEEDKKEEEPEEEKKEEDKKEEEKKEE